MPDPDRTTTAGASALLAVAHGTRDAAGIATIEALLDRVRALRPGLVVRVAYLEAGRPSVEESVTDLAGPVVALPLLLATGYHATVDIPRALAAAGLAGRTLVGAALGPHPLLGKALRDRLSEAGWRRGNPVVLGAAGSSDPAAATATQAQARLLADLVAEPVVVAYASAGRPSVRAAVADLRAAGAGRVAVASYLLAPGHFQTALRSAGADLVSEPLGSHDAVARLVLARYDEVPG